VENLFVLYAVNYKQVFLRLGTEKYVTNVREKDFANIVEDCKWRKTMKNDKGFYCDICSGFITKYQLDLKACEIKVVGGYKLICDECAKKIALYVVEEF